MSNIAMIENSSIFKGLFDGDLAITVNVWDFLLCLGVSLLLGLVMAAAYTVRARYTKSFLITLSILPAIVCVVIMMVNGNIGAGVAVAGAFSLVRFRSVPGSAGEIAYIFFAMGAGLIAGMGYLAYAALFTIVMCTLFILINLISSRKEKNAGRYKTLKIVIPENINYSEVFDDIFTEYTTHVEQTKVKTVNLGSLYSVWYNVTLKDPSKEKEFIDKLRCRNGNLEISVSKQDNSSTEF